MVDLDGVGLTPDPFLAAFGPKVLELGGAGFPFWDALLLFVVGLWGSCCCFCSLLQVAVVGCSCYWFWCCCCWFEVEFANGS